MLRTNFRFCEDGLLGNTDFSPTMHLMTRWVFILAFFTLTAATIVAGGLSRVSAAEKKVSALPHSECADVRQALEDGIPIDPAFRQMEFEFPANEHGIKGRLCRLHAVGSGAHIEGAQIRSLADMHAFIKASLEHAGWRETEQTKRFVDRSQSGKDVFALFKNNAICVATTLISPAPGYIPTTDVKSDGQVYLGSLFPYEREWWIAIDCFHL
jgi:hypothetical protein